VRRCARSSTACSRSARVRAARIYDGYIGNVDIAAYPFESLTVPTLVVAAEDDTLAP
jgi:hypothetical protein